jgi:hypothetical protein
MPVLKDYDGFGKLHFNPDTRRYVYETHRDRLKHYLRKYKGWGIEEDILKDLARYGEVKIRVVVKGEGILETTLNHFMRFGITAQFSTYGVQVFLAESRFLWVKKNKFIGLDLFDEDNK